MTAPDLPTAGTVLGGEDGLADLRAVLRSPYDAEDALAQLDPLEDR